MPDNILLALRGRELGKQQLALAVGKKNPGRFLTDIARHLLADGLIERTIPEKPNSRLQKYRLTARGRSVLAM